MTATPILKVSGLTKHYGGVHAVDDVSFSIGKGEVIGFVGLNGAGKSTTINMLLGFQKPTHGSIELFGETVTLQNAFRSHQSIGFATGDMALFDTMTGRQYLRFIATQYGVTLGASFKELSAMFEPVLDRKIRTLSRGNRQKIALIGAFMVDPSLIILDEPSSGLDPLMQQRFIDLVRSRAESGATVFMSSHYLNEVAEVCSRVLLIKQGRLVKDVSATELMTAAGKHVRVVTRRQISAPKGADILEQEKISDGYLLSFVTHEPVIRIQSWLSGVPNLLDVGISDHDAAATFQELYAPEEADNV